MTKRRLSPRARAALTTVAVVVTVPLVARVALPSAEPWLFLARVALPSPEPLSQVSDELRWRVERLRATGTLRIGEAVVTDRPLTLAVYESRGYQPLWTSQEASTSLVRAVAHAADDGLRPDHYHVSALRGASDSAADPAALAELDLLRTDALVRLGHDLRFGRTDTSPASAAGAGWPAGDPAAVEQLVELVASDRVQEEVYALRPAHFAYSGLVRGLTRLRWIAFLGGWQPIPDGPALRPDSADDRVPLLRMRLWLEGHALGPTDDTTRVYDGDLAAAVRAFQLRNGLTDDGVVGAATLASLNVPIERRIEQLRVNLERVRRVGHELPDTFVAVNVAAARVRVVGGEGAVFESRAIVGRRETPTPTFSARVQYIELNPTWTVPSGIVAEILALQRADSAYLGRQGMRLLDASGREVDPSTVDFAPRAAADFPYVIRQDPGPRNALGRIKLMLPNEHHVYLHDTPERHLFAADLRLFSHGCVRVADPVGLAEVLLADPTWTREALEAAIGVGVTRTIVLRRPVPVMVVYWTATADPDGSLGFHPDVYGLDDAVLAALEHGGEGTSAVGRQ